MTCISGLVHNGTVYIGGDSSGTAGYSQCIRADEKVFLSHGFIYGFTSSYRMGQLLRYCFTPPSINTWDIRKYMVTSYISALQQCFADNGWAKTDEGAKSGGTFLVGTKGQLFTVQDDFQVCSPACNYDAVGCGQDLALGSMYSTPELEPTKRIETALKAAEAFSSGVRGPFTILQLQTGEQR